MSFELTMSNFELPLDESFRKIFKGKISDLLDVSPSDSNAHSKIIKTDTGYRGIIEVISSQGKFVAETVEHDLDNMVKTLFQLIHRQMRHWRSLRFLHD